MRAADAVAPYRARCIPHLDRLRMIQRCDGAEPVPPTLADEVSQTTGAILAEAEAAMAVTVAAVGRGRSLATAAFLGARMARLANAANDAIEAAKNADAPMLRRHVCRFEVLLSAMWTVQLAIPVELERPLSQPTLW